MNLCSSARESWILRLWEKLNKIHEWINCVRSRECRIWRFQESNFQKNFSGGTCPRTRIWGWQFACFFNNLVLNVQLVIQKNSMPRQNEWWYQVWMKQKFEHQRIQNETKLPLRKSLNHRWSEVFMNHESGKARKLSRSCCKQLSLTTWWTGLETVWALDCICSTK